MNETVSFYLNQAPHLTIFPEWLANKKKKANEDFLTHGFPTRLNEHWKYASWDAFLKQRFVKSKTGQMRDQSVGQHQEKESLTVHHTHHPVEDSQRIIVIPLDAAIDLHSDKIAPYLATILTHEDGMQAMNTALFDRGFLIYIPENVIVEQPIYINHSETLNAQAAFIRHLVIMEKGSQATLIESYKGVCEGAYFTNAVTEITLHEKSSLTHYKVQDEAANAFHFSETAVSVGQEAVFNSHVVNIGGAWSRMNLTVHLIEKQSSCFLNGIYLPKQHQYMDHYTAVYHQVENCTSTQNYKGILNDAARGVFNGRVVVEKNAKQTSAKQRNKNLLLSLNAEINTKPQLEIFNDDVVCTHGATVGQLDDEMLFYMASRGISPKEALPFLMKAFLHDNLKALTDETVSTFVNAYIQNNVREE